MVDDINPPAETKSEPALEQEAQNQNTNQHVPTKEEQRANELIQDFDKKMKDFGIKLAVVALVDPALGAPVVYTIGGSYQISKLLVNMTKHFKNEVMKELEA